MNEILTKISNIIVTYESGEWITEDKLRVMHRQLTSNLFFLAAYNTEYFQNHNAIQYKHKGSVSSGLILANEQVPELRMLRKTESTANNVVNAMRSDIATLRKQ
jgi:hypothetical protein